MDKDYTFPEKNGKRIVSELLPTDEKTNVKDYNHMSADKAGDVISDEILNN